MLKKSSLNLAFSANFPDSWSRFQWARQNAYALEYSPDPHGLDLLPGVIRPFIDSDIPVRFHTRYFQYELGHADKYLARKALEAHIKSLKAMHGYGESAVTVHTGLLPECPVKEEHILENLSRLVERAHRLGMTICLENMRIGHGADPFKVFERAEKSGAMITLDVGHARGCAMVMDKQITFTEIVDLFESRLYEVHVYGREDEQGHHPITDIEPLAGVLGRLLQTDCTWWTIELSNQEEAMATRNLLENYFKTKVTIHHRQRPVPSSCFC
ncbi:MAG: TIM barrel protein [Desulfonatronovibrio sp.]